MKDIIRFSYNWNNKLSGNAWTTIRLKDDRRFVVGKTYQINLKNGKDDRFFCYASIEGIRDFYLKELNSFMARIDTGYSLPECTNIITTMYKNIVHDWENQKLSFILLVKVKKETPK